MKTLEPRFKSFSWVPEDVLSDDRVFADLTHDIACGIALMVDIVHQCILEEADEISPMFGAQEREVLMRMAVTTASLLGQEAQRELTAKGSTTSKGGA